MKLADIYTELTLNSRATLKLERYGEEIPMVLCDYNMGDVTLKESLEYDIKRTEDSINDWKEELEYWLNTSDEAPETVEEEIASCKKCIADYEEELEEYKKTVAYIEANLERTCTCHLEWSDHFVVTLDY